MFLLLTENANSVVVFFHQLFTHRGWSNLGGDWIGFRASIPADYSEHDYIKQEYPLTPNHLSDYSIHVFPTVTIKPIILGDNSGVGFAMRQETLRIQLKNILTLKL